MTHDKHMQLASKVSFCKSSSNITKRLARYYLLHILSAAEFHIISHRPQTVSDLDFELTEKCCQINNPSIHSSKKCFWDEKIQKRSGLIVLLQFSFWIEAELLP